MAMKIEMRGREKRISIPSFPYTIVIRGNGCRIGCESHSLKEWASFSERDIGGMFYIDKSSQYFIRNFFNQWRKALLEEACLS